ncbi:MAG: saccharopine dehydrogenase C-terminal domain-containing protein [Bacteroidota bacterium]
MKVAVIGAGAIGSALAEDLCARDAITQVLICDARHSALEELHDRIQSPKMRSFQVDARDVNTIASIVRGSRCIISCVMPEYNYELAEMAVQLGSNYCDLGGDDRITEHVLSLGGPASRKSIWVVPNCGLAPGLVNILCMYGIHQFDSVKSARLRVGAVPLEPKDPLNLTIPFSADQFIDKLSLPVTLIEDGKLKHFEPLSGIEPIAFDAHDSPLEAFYSSGSLSTLPHDLLGKVETLDFKTVACPGLAQKMKFVIALGLTDRRHIDVRTHRTYRDVFVRQLKRKTPENEPDVVLLRVSVTGVRDGETQTFVAKLHEEYDATLKISAMKQCTAVSAAIVAELLGSHQIAGGGAAPPEQIVPHKMYFDLLRERGVKISSQWQDAEVAA